jgi:Endonuclease/Exonuclease/phosphatase family
MRVLTWNMAKNRSADAWAFLERVGPDVALLQEAPAALAEHAVDRGWRTALWTESWPDGTWGSAVLAKYATLELEWADRSRGAVLLAQGRIDGVGMASIASIHVRGNHESGLVVPPLKETLAEIRARLLPAFIVGGDLNTARQAALIWRYNGHLEFWEDLDAQGYFREPLPPGGERQSFWRKGSRSALQDDHIFVDKETFLL